MSVTAQLISEEPKTLHLPYGIALQVGDGYSSISSSLVCQFVGEGRSPSDQEMAYADAIESFLLALASEGVDVQSDAVTSALHGAVSSIASQLD
ncbi:hypothetical protein [Marinobacter alkaliphilus]|uniref:DUF3077 domain-containing protein n=1 Tax=Marinobacter alkaliphilus TaxID=254719 RepID=A0ABZ3E9B1_9GAMM